MYVCCVLFVVCVCARKTTESKQVAALGTMALFSRRRPLRSLTECQYRCSLCVCVDLSGQMLVRRRRGG